MSLQSASIDFRLSVHQNGVSGAPSKLGDKCIGNAASGVSREVEFWLLMCFTSLDEKYVGMRS